MKGGHGIWRGIRYADWGLTGYKEAEARQLEHFEAILAKKRAARRKGLRVRTDNFLFFCAHRPVFTLGRNGEAAHLLARKAKLEALGIEFHRCGRGGDMTYHGPGQLVAYPVWDLENFFMDIGRYMRTLEEGVLRTMSDFGLRGHRIKGLTGVWIEGRPPRKIAALGVRTSHWVCMHGLAFNLNTDLDPYRYIVPCGISGKGVTSMEVELGYSVSEARVKARLRAHLCDLFGAYIVKGERIGR